MNRGHVRKLRISRIIESDTFLGYLTLVPIILWVMGVLGYPLYYATSLSLRDQTLIGTASSFVGFQTYQKVLTNETFWIALRNTAVWTFGNTIVQGIFALTTALILNELTGWFRWLRSLFIIPWIVPTAVAALMWGWIVNPSYGVLPYFFTETFPLFDRIPALLGEPQWVMLTTIIINAWRWFPFGSIIILARLQDLSEETIEAAKLDGAGGLQLFLYIIWPHLQSVMSIFFLLGSLWAFNSFDTLWLLTGGGPGNKTTTLPILIYRFAFNNYQMSQAAAVSILMLLLLGFFTFLFFKFMYRPD